MPSRVVRIVLDTNVLISGVYFPDGTPGRVITLARKRRIENVISPYILNETERILIEKFHWQADQVTQTLRFFQSFSRLVSPGETLQVISHASDNRVLECAVEGKAHYIVSGDRHLKRLVRYGPIEVVDPAGFMAMIGGLENH